jgi:hypothetical protein
MSSGEETPTKPPAAVEVRLTLSEEEMEKIAEKEFLILTIEGKEELPSELSLAEVAQALEEVSEGKISVAKVKMRGVTAEVASEGLEEIEVPSEAEIQITAIRLTMGNNKLIILPPLVKGQKEKEREIFLEEIMRQLADEIGRNKISLIELVEVGVSKSE